MISCGTIPVMRLPSKAILITIGVVTGLAVGGFGVTQSEAAMDWLGLEQKLTNHDETLDNHEDRLDNTEADVADLQTNTNTPPSADRVIVREVVTPNTTVTNPPPQEPVPVVVVSAYEKVVVDEHNTDCRLIYSDGTAHAFRWKSVNGNNFTIAGRCDDKVLGQPKANTTYGY